MVFVNTHMSLVAESLTEAILLFYKTPVVIPFLIRRHHKLKFWWLSQMSSLNCPPCTLRLCLVGLIWGDLLYKKMDLRGWRLFGWPDLGGWMRRDLQDWIFAHPKRFAGIWRDEDRNYEIVLINEVEITK